MKQLSLDNLRTFACVIDLGGYAKAGDYLGRSQPAISQQIKKLESQLGRSLFEKVGQRHQPNRDGMLLYEHAKALLAKNDEIFHLFDVEPLRGRLRLGIPNEFAITLLPGIVGQFSKLYPNVALEVTSALSRELLSGDPGNRFDIVLALVDPGSNSNGHVIREDDLVWVGDKRQPLDGRSLSLVVAPDGCVYRSRIIDRLKQQTIAWRIGYTNADLSGLTAAIQQGLGVSALASASVPKELDVIRHPSLPDLGKINICLFKPPGRQSQAGDALAEFIERRLRQG